MPQTSTEISEELRVGFGMLCKGSGAYHIPIAERLLLLQSLPFQNRPRLSQLHVAWSLSTLNRRAENILCWVDYLQALLVMVVEYTYLTVWLRALAVFVSASHTQNFRKSQAPRPHPSDSASVALRWNMRLFRLQKDLFQMWQIRILKNNMLFLLSLSSENRTDVELN